MHIGHRQPQNLGVHAQLAQLLPHLGEAVDPDGIGNEQGDAHVGQQAVVVANLRAVDAPAARCAHQAHRSLPVVQHEDAFPWHQNIIKEHHRVLLVVARGERVGVAGGRHRERLAADDLQARWWKLEEKLVNLQVKNNR